MTKEGNLTRVRRERENKERITKRDSRKQFDTMSAGMKLEYTSSGKTWNPVVESCGGVNKVSLA